jgi:hypothetical protein
LLAQLVAQRFGNAGDGFVDGQPRRGFDGRCAAAGGGGWAGTQPIVGRNIAIGIKRRLGFEIGVGLVVSVGAWGRCLGGGGAGWCARPLERETAENGLAPDRASKRSNEGAMPGGGGGRITGRVSTIDSGISRFFFRRPAVGRPVA